MAMMRSGPSLTVIVAALALVVALAGTALAAPDLATRAISKSTVKKIAAKQADKVVTQLQAALNVNHAKSADSANHANSAGTANHATTAGTANHANTAGGAPPTGGAGGALSGTYPNPGFEKNVVPLVLNAGWAPELGTAPVPAVWKDAYNVVHFRGALRQTPAAASGSPFTLPPQFRPATDKNSLVAVSGGIGYVAVPPTGVVGSYILTGGSTIGFLNIEEVEFEAGT